jgi:hypothetical protein
MIVRRAKYKFSDLDCLQGIECYRFGLFEP